MKGVRFCYTFFMPVSAQGLVSEAPNPITDIEAVVSSLLGTVTSVVGLAIFVMFLVGAFQFLTAGNNEENVKKARQTFTYAVIGGAALIFLYVVFLFLKEFTGLDLLKFNVCITGSGAFCQ